MSSGNNTPDRMQAPQPQKALKYRYDAFIEEWSCEECVVMIARKPFAEGGMRWCYKMYEIDRNGKHAPGVAKTFKDDAVEEDDDEEVTKAYFDEAMTQTVADSFAQQFNQVLGDSDESEQLKCRFLPVRVMQFYGKTGKNALCNCEPYLQGSYVKHNDNDGNVETCLEVPQAFSHFTWEYSNQLILVCDIQGVDNYFTDPQIHSHDGASFGMGNMGQDGIDRFLESHKCNSLCRRLGLEPPERTPDGKWKSSSAVTKSMVTVNSFKSSMSSTSISSTWTAKKYDAALDAITRATKKKGSAKETDSTDSLTQQQLTVLQSKLSMLIQQHGSMNQLLLSPQRRSRKKAPQAEIKNRPWSPVRGVSPRRGGASTGRVTSEGFASPLGRQQGLVQRPRSPNRSGSQSPVAAGRKLSPERSSYGKISSSYEREPISRDVPAARSYSEADYEAHLAAMEAGASPKAKLSSDLYLGQGRLSQKSELAQPVPRAKPGMLASWSQFSNHQQSSPCILGSGGDTKLEAMCKYCHLTGSVELVLATGPWHNATCKRWSKQPPAQRKEHHGRLRDGSPVREGEVLSEEDQKKKDLLHKQMLVLKKQLEEQLLRLQSKGHVEGAAPAGGESTKKGGKFERYNRP